jgi:type IV secretion system protein TrbI
VTDNGPSEGAGPVLGPRSSAEDHARALRLTAERPRITRLSRKVLAGGSALTLLLISSAVLWALRSNHPHTQTSDELYSTDHHNVADGLANLPQDYAGVARNIPQLGPPLTGDLGRPIVTAAGQSAPIGIDAEQQRASQETEAARTSKVFASATPVAQPHAPSQETSTNVTSSSSDETLAQNGQGGKLLFVNAPVDRRTTAPDRISRPASPFVIQAGTIIPAALITGIRSDLPGQITAQVTENIFDTPTGRAKLVPQGLGSSASTIAKSPSVNRGCCWSGHGCSCRMVDPSSWNGSRAPMLAAIPASRTRSTITGSSCSRRHCSRPSLVWEPSLAPVRIRAVTRILFKPCA